MSKIKDIAFWGTEAPPYGGMTVHIQRLTQYLQSKGWIITQYNFNKEKRDKTYILNISNFLMWYIRLWFMKSPKVHYIITTRAKIRFLASLLTIRGKKVIIRVGGESMKNEIQKGGLSKFLNLLSLKLCSGFIGVNHEICQVASKYTHQHKINLIAGFIPPHIEDQKPPIEIIEFLKQHSLKIIVTGTIFEKGEKDIYGLYHFVDALNFLENINYSAVIVISGSNIPNFSKNLKEFVKYIHQNNLNDKVYIHIGDVELWPIIKEGDVFVRPSITDGDANSIREALYFKKYVIASDCVQRPANCVLYETLNSAALADKILHIQSRQPNFNVEDGNGKKIESLLESLIKQ